MRIMKRQFDLGILALTISKICSSEPREYPETHISHRVHYMSVTQPPKKIRLKIRYLDRL